MGWFTRDRDDAEEKRASGLARPESELLDALTTGRAVSGKRVSVANAMGVAPVWAAVSIISEQIGQLPLKVYRQVDDGERVEARQHRAWRILHDRPNDATPAGRFWATVVVHLLLFGNAYLYKERDELGLVEALWLLHPTDVTVKWNAVTRVKTFEHRSTEALQTVEYGTDEVLHIMGLSLDGLAGESVIASCRNAFGAAMARDEFEGGFYNRGAVLSGYVKAPQGIRSDQALKRLAAGVRQLFGGSARSFEIGVFEDGAEWVPAGSPLKDLEFVQAQQLTRTDIAVMFKLPPNYLGGSSGDPLTYSTVEMNQQHFALHAIAPWTSTIAEALSQDPSLMPQGVHSAEFVLEGMLKGDAKSRAEFYTAMTAMQAMTVNEVRAKENMPPLPGGDTIDKPQPPVTDPAVTPRELVAANGNDTGATDGP